MHNDSVEVFVDNWTYLKTELTWLDRVLSLAVAKQRKETKEIDRIARSRADRVTSHWWKGLINLEVEVFSDSPAEGARRRSTATTLSFQQQMEARILASQQQGIALGIPCLSNRLQLNLFEKNLVVMALAPEINRRYGRLYNYLQETEQPGASGLPSVDLILRLLCRNDADWRSARVALSPIAPLVQLGLLNLQMEQPQPLLARLVKLSDPLVDYLLADQPADEVLERLLHPPLVQSAMMHPPLAQPAVVQSALVPSAADPCPMLLQCIDALATGDRWHSLVLPDFLLSQLKQLCQYMQSVPQVNALWQFQGCLTDLPAGQIALLTGITGTGKTTAAGAIAQTLQSPLYYADLKLLPTSGYLQLLEEVTHQSPTVLLLKSAQVWFGRSATLPPEHLHQFLQQRRRDRAITLFAVERLQMVKPTWRREMHPVLDFPLPDQSSRLRLWQQMFPTQVHLDGAIDWKKLAKFPITGGQIQTIAHAATLAAVAESPEPKVTMQHLLQAYDRLS
jgi:hypothetical protein